MPWLVNLTIRKKLLFGFGIMVVFLILGLVASWLLIDRIWDRQVRLYTQNIAEVVGLLDISIAENRIRGLTLQATIVTDATGRQAFLREIADTGKEIDKHLEKLAALYDDDPESIGELERLRNLVIDCRNGREKIFVLLESGNLEEARSVATTAQDVKFESLKNLTIQMVDAARNEAEDLIEETAYTIIRTFLGFVLGWIVAVGFAIYIVVLLNRMIAAPLRKLAVAVEQISSGDLSVPWQKGDRLDEVGVLMESFGRMLTNLRAVNAKTKEAVSVLSSSAGEIVAVTGQVAAGASETATAISETTTTVEEVKQTVIVTNQKAKIVSDNAQQASTVAKSGRIAVDTTTESMNRIREQMESIAHGVIRLSEQSQAIGEIISTVNDLADQSNLLAVNAAIEAARAGEHGKGFGVVAQEVRSLAEQSREATAQVRSILGDIQKAMGTAVMATERGSKAVEEGVARASEAGQAIRHLAEGIAEAAQVATQIAASSQQQLAGMEQISVAMESIQQASAQNVEGTKQTNEAVRGLQDLGNELKRLSEAFRM